MASPRGEGFSPNRCLQNNDCFVPKPLRFKCLRILSLLCVICARRKNASAFSALLVVSHGPWVQPQSAAHCTQCAKSHRQRQQKPRFTLSLLCLTNSGIRSAMQALLSRRGGQRFTEALLFPPVRIPLYVAKRKQRHPVQGAFVFVGKGIQF